jgi:hypothetical protein
MTTPPAADTRQPSTDRAVLIWRPDTDESHVRPSVEQAAGFLQVSAADVVAAIDSGDLLSGHFVDWQAGPA